VSSVCSPAWTSRGRGRPVRGSRSGRDDLSGATGKVREIIQQAVTRILARVDGGLTIEATPGGLLGLDGDLSRVGDREDQTLFAAAPLSTEGRQWKLSQQGMMREFRQETRRAPRETPTLAMRNYGERR
jgi:hypothetical protein